MTLLQEVFRDPLFEGRVAEAEMRDIAAASPEASEAINLVSARSELLSTFGVLLAMFGHVLWQRRVRASLAFAE